MLNISLTDRRIMFILKARDGFRPIYLNDIICNIVPDISADKIGAMKFETEKDAQEILDRHPVILGDFEIMPYTLGGI